MRPSSLTASAIGLQRSEEDAAHARSARARDLVLAHHDLIWRVLRRLGVPRSDVDDATQQVFWVAVQKICDEPSPRDARFLLAISLRVAADFRRALRRRREVSFEENGVEASARSFIHEHAERVDALQTAELLLEQIPPEQRIVFVLFELEEKCTQEIADLLEIPVGTVASRLRRARVAFAEASARYRARAQRGAPK